MVSFKSIGHHIFTLVNILKLILLCSGEGRKNREWTDEDMYDMIEKINQGYTYQDVTDGTHVPILTLWTR